MAKRMNEESIDAKVKAAQQKVLKLKAAYDAAVAELDEPRKLQRQLRAENGLMPWTGRASHSTRC